MTEPTIHAALRAAARDLGAACALDPAEARAQAECLLAGALGCTRLAARLRGGEPLRRRDAARFSALVRRRALGEPVQYILGEQDFMGNRFLADARALIPRLDTEVLCERALARIPADRPAHVLDMGTGGGALAVTIALVRRQAEVVGADISLDALALARRNAALLLPAEGAVRFVHSDLFSALGGERFDVILSNPPYIARGELASLPADVRREPRLALDGGPDGLDFYRRLAAEAPDHLRPGGALIVEVGAGQAAQVSALFAGRIGPPAVYDDLQGIPRVVCAALEGG